MSVSNLADVPEVMVEEAIPLPPTEDDLPYDDGMPMETHRHVAQMYLLIETLRNHWATRPDGFVSGNMFVYFRPDQQQAHNFRGPDFFAVTDVARRERKSWVTWYEGKAPDVVIELLSPSTARFDKTEKKRIYQDHLRVPEYFWYDPFSGELAGFSLQNGVYQPILPDEQGRLWSDRIDLFLLRWDGAFLDADARWVRWATADGQLILLNSERAEAERERAEVAHAQAEAERERAEVERERAEVAHAQAEAERERAEAEHERADAERERADAEHERAERLAARLRALGIDPQTLE